MSRIPVSEATPTQLAAFATSNLGLDGVSHTLGRDKILAKMTAVGFSDDEIDVPDVKVPTAQIASMVGGSVDAAVPRRMVRIMIPVQTEPGGKHPVVVGVNGRVARIERGKEVDVPEEYVHALSLAAKTVFDKDENGSPVNPTSVLTHPFSIIRPAA